MVSLKPIHLQTKSLLKLVAMHGSTMSASEVDARSFALTQDACSLDYTWQEVRKFQQFDESLTQVRENAKGRGEEVQEGYYEKVGLSTEDGFQPEGKRTWL